MSGHARYIVGDVFTTLRSMPPASVDLVLTSPPFLGLRSYLPDDDPNKANEVGAETSPAAFVDVLLALAYECRRVLTPHGSLCVELGDTYSGGGGAGGDYSPGGMREGQPKYPRRKIDDAWPLAKSLCGVPFLFPLSLAYGRNLLTGLEHQAGKWRIRNVVAWCRPNPPVGFLGDKFRPATSYMTMACVSGSRFFDLDAVRTAHSIDPTKMTGTSRHGQLGSGRRQGGDDRHEGDGARSMLGNPMGAPPLDWWHYAAPLEDKPSKPSGGGGYNRGTPSAKDDGTKHGPRNSNNNPNGAPPLDWWEIATAPFAGAHFATWPADLCTRPILTMCPQWVCRECGKPRERITEQTEEYAAFRKSMNEGTGIEPGAWDKNVGNRASGFSGSASKVLKDHYNKTHTTVGWTDCGHNDYRRGVVLDPFAGSGTTLSVATGHGRDAIGIDLDARNALLAERRVGMFLTVEMPYHPQPPHEQEP